MLDVLYIAGTIVFFGLMLLYGRALAALGGAAETDPSLNEPSP